MCAISEDQLWRWSNPAGGAGHLYATLGDRFGLSHKKKPNPRRKMAQRDLYQRKVYAVHRMSLAVMRLSRATSQAEKEKVLFWAKMWGAVGGIRQFKLGNGGGGSGNGKGGDRS